MIGFSIGSPVTIVHVDGAGNLDLKHVHGALGTVVEYQYWQRGNAAGTFSSCRYKVLLENGDTLRDLEPENLKAVPGSYNPMFITTESPAPNPDQ